MSLGDAPWLGPALVGAAFLVLAVLETLSPLRPRTQPRLRRSLRNGLTGLLAVSLARPLQLLLLLPFAAWCSERRVGLLHFVEWPGLVEGLIAILLLDWSLWYWHWLNHRCSPLWRFHRVHHEDRDLDASTALRFHFGELCLSVGWRVLQVAIVGAGAAQLAIYTLVLAVSTFFHHANLRLPLALERALLPLVVTPRMHGIHHSNVGAETNSNYSSLLSVWDRLHGTLRLNVPSSEIVIGLPGGRAEAATVWRLQAMPFRFERAPAAASRDRGAELDAGPRTRLSP